MTIARRFLPTPPRISGRSWEDVAPELHRFLELLSRVSFGNSIHTSLGSLDSDDHLQYIRTDGTRDFTGDQSMGGNSLTNAESVQFDPTPATIPTAVGGLYWDGVSLSVVRSGATLQVLPENTDWILAGQVFGG